MPTPSHRPNPRTGPVIAVIISALVLIAAGITVVALFRAEESVGPRAASVGDRMDGTTPPSGAVPPGANAPVAGVGVGAGAGGGGAEATPRGVQFAPTNPTVEDTTPAFLPQSPNSPPSPAGEHTVIHMVSPVDRAGNIQDGWRQSGEKETVGADCYGSPLTNEDNIYSCGPPVLGAQACFHIPETGLSYCPDGPFSQTYRVATFTGTFTSHLTGVAPSDPYPWGLVLEDGRRCLSRMGGAWGTRDDGYYGIYSCDTPPEAPGEPEVVLAHENEPEAIDHNIQPWTVKVGELGLPGMDMPEPTTAEVAEAYYVAWPDGRPDDQLPTSQIPLN